jgi:hypothetical protein
MTMKHTFTILTALLLAPLATLSGAVAEDHLEVVRFPNNPIIRPEMLPGHDGGNINGPSLICAPAWLPKPLGKYYLYFANHHGKYIRLAYADQLAGPWKIYEPGTLKLEEAPGCQGHIASPELVVDDERKELRMYFHGPAKEVKAQKTFVAVSTDGLHFKASAEVLGIFYWRVFQWDGWWYGMGKGGFLYRSRSGLTGFEEGPNPFPPSEFHGKREIKNHGVRHVALLQDGSRLWIYYTNMGDAPERIFRCHLELTGDWKTWKTSKPEEVLRPETDWEGERLPVKESKNGAAEGRENALRDPAIFVEDGHVYLLYSVAGEFGIAIAECRNATAAPKPPKANP